MRIAILLLLVACTKTPDPPRVLTELQKELIATYTLEQKVYMEDCLKVIYRSFSSCQEDMVRAFHPAVTKSNGGSSMMSTVVGTAVGYGAARVLLGK